MTRAGTEEQAAVANLNYYESHTQEFTQRTSSLDLSELHEMFLQHLARPPAHILDAGCGPGRDSVAFLAKGYRVSAIDASPAMVRQARRLGIAADVMRFQDIEYQREFDGVWACASLLHVPRTLIVDVILRLQRALLPGGVVLMTLKEGEGQRFVEDGRFFVYYRLDEFRSLLETVSGWSVVEARLTQDRTAQKWVQFLARKNSDEK